MTDDLNKRWPSRIGEFFESDDPFEPDQEPVDGRFRYDPYGLNVSRSPADDAETNSHGKTLLFQGGMMDAMGELVHFGARDFDPRIGRWLEPGHEPMAYVDGAGEFPFSADE